MLERRTENSTNKGPSVGERQGRKEQDGEGGDGKVELTRLNAQLGEELSIVPRDKQTERESKNIYDSNGEVELARKFPRKFD